jgi:hypothetical protein
MSIDLILPELPKTFRDTRGRWRTQSLFLEQAYGSTAKETPVYTMKGEDSDGLPSFKRLYLEIADPTDYRQATLLLGGWDHWQVLLGSKWFSDYIADLRAELDIKLRSEGVLKMLSSLYAADVSRAQVAAKYFADQAYKAKRKPGRPSKEDVARQAREIAESDRRIRDDAARLGLSVVPRAN